MSKTLIVEAEGKQYVIREEIKDAIEGKGPLSEEFLATITQDEATFLAIVLELAILPDQDNK